MLPQGYQQTTGQSSAAVQNPQSNVSSPAADAQGGLQSVNTQQVLGQQDARIAVPGSSGSYVKPAKEVAQTADFSIVPLIVLAVVLLAVAHVFVLVRRKQKRRLDASLPSQENTAPAATKKPTKKHSKKKKKNKHHR